MVHLKKAAGLLGGALLLGCGGGAVPERAELRLADLKSATLHVAQISEHGPGIPPERYGMHVEVTFQGAPTDCFTFAPEVRATVAGRELSLVPGELKEGTCGVSRFSFNLAGSYELLSTPPRQDVVELSDGQDVFRVTIHGLLTRRGFTRLTNMLPIQPLKAGQTLVYDWIPQTDVFVEEPAVPHASFLLRGQQDIPVQLRHAETPLTEDRKFEVPVPAFVTSGYAEADLEGHSRIPVLSCEGPAGCEARGRFHEVEAFDVYRR